MNQIGKLLGLAALVSITAAASAQSYALIDLTQGSPFDYVGAYGLNDLGQVVGAGEVPVTEDLHAFMYQNGVFQDLGEFGYPYGADADAINNVGQIAATGYGPGYNALIYSNGTAHRLGSNDGGSSVGFAINNLGSIVGRAVNGDGGNQGFTYINGHFANLPVDIARGINDSNDFVGSLGYSWVYGGYVHVVEHAFLNVAGSYTDLGDIGGGLRTNTEAYAVNSSGQVTGYSTAVDGTIHAFLYSSGLMSDLGTFPPYYTYGVSINDAGQVVGNIETYVGGQISSFIYSNGQMQDLANLLDASGTGWSGLAVTKINNHGWIVGNGTYSDGSSRGFLLRPYFTEQPTAYSIFRGTYLSGTLASLFSVDGDYLSVRLGLTINTQEPPISIIISSTSTEASPTDLRFSMTAHTDTVGLTQTIELWDYQASAWVVVGSQAATTANSTELVVATNPARFVQAGTKAIKARVSWKQTGPTSHFPWSASIDQVFWTDSP